MVLKAQAIAIHSEPSDFERNKSDISISQPKQFQKLVADDMVVDEREAINTSGLTQAINLAIIHKQWDLLEQWLPEYKQLADADMILYRYALGALKRYHGDYQQAIELYSSIIQEREDLIYPHFDLALMLIEDKQYQQAETELNKLLTKSPIALQKRIETYLKYLKRQQRWQPDFSLQYEQTDNVNNAASSKEIMINGRKFIRNDDSLPKSAHGFAYSLGLSRDKNILGHHFVYFSSQLRGIYYWDVPEYQERSIDVSLGYKYKTAKYYFGVIPFIEYNRLGNQAYSRRYGVKTEYVYQINSDWFALNSIQHFRRFYVNDDLAKRYDGFNNRWLSGLNWQPSSHWRLYGYLDWSVDRLVDKSESSYRYGVMLGGVYHKNFGGQLSLRYGQRYFLDEHFLFQQKRLDKEYTLNVALWHNKVVWKGFQPKLHYRYRKISSNFNQLYDRSSGEWFVTIDKNF